MFNVNLVSVKSDLAATARPPIPKEPPNRLQNELLQITEVTAQSTQSL